MVRSRFSWLLAAITLGCSAEPGLKPDDEGMRAYAEASCAATYACECSDLDFFDEDDCRDQLFEGLHRFQLSARVGGATYDDACTRDKIAAFEDLGCDPLGDSSPRVSCQFFHGDVPEGERCEAYGVDMSSCAQGLLCAGICIDPATGSPEYQLGEGAPCSEDGELLGLCEAGLRCDPDAGLCVHIPTVGDPCSLTASCYDGFCDAGICMARRADGQSCTDDSQCLGVCADGVCGPRTEALACSTPLL